MLGISAYGSSDEEPTPTPAAPTAAVAPQSLKQGEQVGVKRKLDDLSAAEAPDAKKPNTNGNKKKKTALTSTQIAQIRKEIDAAKSATAVVQVVRRSFEVGFDAHWGAEALYQIAKRSTARTRREWAEDKDVKMLAGKLKLVAASDMSLEGRVDDAEVLLISLEALRRMKLQDAVDQSSPLERVTAYLIKHEWRYPVKALARLVFLTSPLKIQGAEVAPKELKSRYTELDGTDVALLISAMRSAGGNFRDAALLSKLIIKMKLDGWGQGGSGLGKNLSATDLVEIAEGFVEIESHDEAVLRSLGQFIQMRRAELTPEESSRVHVAYQKVKLNLNTIWKELGASTKRDASELVTSQTFGLQDGHFRYRRGNNDVQRASPPRVVRDMKMASY